MHIYDKYEKTGTVSQKTYYQNLQIMKHLFSQPETAYAHKHYPAKPQSTAANVIPNLFDKNISHFSKLPSEKGHREHFTIQPWQG